MADRLFEATKDLKKFAQDFHDTHPGERLLIIVASHYDTISPTVKKYVANLPETQYVAVDYAGGIGLHISETGETTTQVGGQKWNVDL